MNSSAKTHSPATVIPELREPLSQVYAQLGAAVGAVIKPVCAQHVAIVRRQIPSAQRLNDLGILDDLPLVLKALAQTFSHPDGLQMLALIGPAHAAAREGQNFSISEMIGEYVLLRRSLSAQTVRELGRPFTDAEAEAFQAGIDAIIAAMVGSVTGQREARLKLENSALSDFLISLAHDIRNEINGVLTSMTLLEETGGQLKAANLAPGDPHQSTTVARIDQLLQDIQDSRNAMVSTTNAMEKLLAAERLRNQPQFRLRETSLYPLLHGIARSTERTHRGTRSVPDDGSARVKVSCNEHLLLRTDPDLLTTILGNLLGNAIKYAPQGAIILAATESAEGVSISVADEGPGMSPAQVARIFNKFERGAGGGEGMGLGLYIASRAAELLGATIGVTSELGQGSCFTVDIRTGPALPTRELAAAPAEKSG